jgi:hypothetical protein
MAGDMSAIIITITDRNKCFPTITEYIAEIKLDNITKLKYKIELYYLLFLYSPIEFSSSPVFSSRICVISP